jgi:MinD-like ATPase involved in chromosome partitioning or flagellar assembly
LLNAILFSLDPGLAALVRGIADQSIEFTLERLVDSQPTGFEISRTLSTSNADAVLLEVADPERDIVYAEAIHMAGPNLPTVALTRHDISKELEFHPDCGITEVLLWPFSVADFEDALQRAVRGAGDAHHAGLVAFLPGKAGSGNSTTVMNTADMLAGHLKKRVLVMEADLHSGLFTTLLDVKPRRSIRHALHHAKTLELPDWDHCLIRASGVDYLVTDTAVKEPVPSWSDYYQLLNFVLPRYDLVLVDLPEVVNAATAEIVRTARAVYVVTTPELPSLALARQRFQELARWGVEDERLFAILNRWHKHDLSASDVEEILRHPVAATIRNDYRIVQQVIAEAKILDTDNDLGAAFLDFACMLAGETNTNKPKVSRFHLFRAS